MLLYDSNYHFSPQKYKNDQKEVAYNNFPTKHWPKTARAVLEGGWRDLKPPTILSCSKNNDCYCMIPIILLVYYNIRMGIQMLYEITFQQNIDQRWSDQFSKEDDKIYSHQQYSCSENEWRDSKVRWDMFWEFMDWMIFSVSGIKKVVAGWFNIARTSL